MSKWVNADGTLNLDALNELETSVRMATDSNAAIDAVIKGEKLGQPKTAAFRCAHSTLYWPADYAKGWGTKFGAGLGSQVVSESWDSLYHVSLPSLFSADQPTQLMHPVVVSHAQVDLAVIPTSEYDAGRLISEKEDPTGAKRVAIVFQKQMVNPKSRLKLIMAQMSAQKAVAA